MNQYQTLNSCYRKTHPLLFFLSPSSTWLLHHLIKLTLSIIFFFCYLIFLKEHHKCPFIHKIMNFTHHDLLRISKQFAVENYCVPLLLQLLSSENVYLLVGFGIPLRDMPELQLNKAVSALFSILHCLYNVLLKFFAEERYGDILYTCTETARSVMGKE